jgi:hypothetical protein
MLLVILTNQKKEYTIYVEKIDNFSPDRKLIVYENKKKIDFKEIQYEDGIVLCSGNNPTVSYSEVAGEKELIVKLNNKKQVIAKIKEK